jgi:hypothetical protein
MTGVLGYSRFAAQGGDWGGQITSDAVSRDDLLSNIML